MHRARVLSIVLVVCALGINTRAQGPTPTTPDGWVVLGVDEYRAELKRALGAATSAKTRLDLLISHPLCERLVPTLPVMDLYATVKDVPDQVLVKPAPERLTFEQLHDNDRMIIMSADVIDDADVIVLERGRGLRFVDEAVLGFGIARQIGRKELQGYVPA